MSLEMCPSCRKSCNMIRSTSTRTLAGADGRKKVVRVVSFHCEKCRQFVRSEEEEEQLAVSEAG